MNDNIIPITRQVALSINKNNDRPPRLNLTSPGNPYTKPRTVAICSACGTRKPIPGEQYCKECVLAGRDNPFVECTGEGCTTVAKRRYKGQQFFICNQHKKETP